MIDPANLFPQVHPARLNSTINRMSQNGSTYFNLWDRLTISGVVFHGPESINTDVSEAVVNEAWEALFIANGLPPEDISMFYSLGSCPSANPFLAPYQFQELAFKWFFSLLFNIDAIEPESVRMVVEDEATQEEMDFIMALLRFISFRLSQLESAIVLLNAFGLDNRGRPAIA